MPDDRIEYTPVWWEKGGFNPAHLEQSLLPTPFGDQLAMLGDLQGSYAAEIRKDRSKTLDVANISNRPSAWPGLAIGNIENLVLSEPFATHVLETIHDTLADFGTKVIEWTLSSTDQALASLGSTGHEFDYETFLKEITPLSVTIDRRWFPHAAHLFGSDTEVDSFAVLEGLLSDADLEDGIEHPAEAALERVFLYDVARTEDWITKRIARGRASDFAKLVTLASRVSSVTRPLWLADLLRRALGHEALIVRDAAVCGAERWGSPEALTLLRSHHEPSAWLARYIERLLAESQA